MPDDVSKRIEEIRERLAPALALGAWRQVAWNGKPDAEVTTSPPGIVEGDKHICDCRSANYSDAGRDVEIARFIANAPADIDWLLNRLGEFLYRSDELMGFMEAEAWLPVWLRYDPMGMLNANLQPPMLTVSKRKPGSVMKMSGVNCVIRGKTATAMRKDLAIPCRHEVEGELVILAKKRKDDGADA